MIKMEFKRAAPNDLDLDIFFNMVSFLSDLEKVLAGGCLLKS